MSVWVKGGVGDCSIDGFRHRNGSGSGPMSKKFYRDLQALGLGPKETVVGGKVFVFPEAEAEWRAARTNPTGDEAKRVAAVRAKWHRRALAAGRAAAKSPKHVSKLQLGRRKRARAK
jgi:hypothetical protein